MKAITIFQKNQNQIKLIDDDDSNILEYSKRLSEIMKSMDIVILETLSECLIIRPKEISAINIKENEDIYIDDRQLEK